MVRDELTRIGKSRVRGTQRNILEEEVFRRKHTKSLFVISRRGEQSESGGGEEENLINLIIIRRIRLWHESRFFPFFSFLG